jgi:hypothetical protein
MSRADVQQSLSTFFDRAACATVADEALLATYLSSLGAYITELEEAFEPIDDWSVQELQRVSEYILHNRQWVLGSDQAIQLLAVAYSAIDRHKEFLATNGLLPDYLGEMPNNSFEADGSAAAQLQR